MPRAVMVVTVHGALFSEGESSKQSDSQHTGNGGLGFRPLHKGTSATSKSILPFATACGMG